MSTAPKLETTENASYDLALAAAHHAIAKKATDVVLIDMREHGSFADYVVVCTGQTSRQTKAIAEDVRRGLRDEMNARPRRVEGDKEGDWILLDLLDVVLHVFTPETRDFYRLDRLWRRAPQETITDPLAPPALAAGASAPIIQGTQGD